MSEKPKENGKGFLASIKLFLQKYAIATTLGAIATCIALALQIRGYVLDRPQIDLEITKLSFYNDYDSTYTSTNQINPSFVSSISKKDSIWIYRPWIGIVGVVRNQGRQPKTIIRYSIRSFYRSISKTTWDHTYYHAGPYSDKNPSSSNYQITLNPGERVSFRLIFLLDIPLTKEGRRLYHLSFNQTPLISKQFSSFELLVIDADGNLLESTDYLEESYEKLVTRPSGSIAPLPFTIVQVPMDNFRPRITLETEDFFRPFQLKKDYY